MIPMQIKPSLIHMIPMKTKHSLIHNYEHDSHENKTFPSHGSHANKTFPSHDSHASELTKDHFFKPHLIDFEGGLK